MMRVGVSIASKITLINNPVKLLRRKVEDRAMEQLRVGHRGL